MITLKVLVVLLHIVWFGGFGLTLLLGLFLGIVAADSGLNGLSLSGFLKYIGVMAVCVIALAIGADVVQTFRPEIAELFSK